MLARWSVLALLGLAALPSQAASVLARVFFDADGNGQQDRGEVGAPQVLVSDGDRIYRTDASGEARLEVIRAAHESARVFVISPGGHRTTTPWHEAVDPAAAEERAVLFGLQPVTVRAEQPIAITADTQATVANARQVATALLEELCPPGALPAFAMLLGDLTEQGTAAELAAWRAAVAAAPVPVHHVFGAHDGGNPPRLESFERELGPGWYAFWWGGRCHLVLVAEPEVLSGQQQARQLRWLRRLLVALPARSELVVYAHVPPAWSELEQIGERHRLRAVCYGHWHENSVWWRDGVPLICTGPYRGEEWGVGTGSFRRVRFTADRLEATVVTAGVRRLLEVLTPGASQPPERVQMPLRVVAYDSRQAPGAVEARLDEAAAVALRPAGRFAWQLDLPASYARRLTVQARTADGQTWERAVALAEPRPAPRVELQNAGPPRPPLTRAWLTNTGVARLANGGLAYADGRLYLGLPDENLPSAAGVVCLDAATGRELWRSPTQGAVRREPMTAGGRVFAMTATNVVYAFDGRSGQRLWERDLTPQVYGRHRSSHTGLTLWRDRVLAQVGGGPLVALAQASGTVLGQLDLGGAVYGAPAVEGELGVVATTNGLVTFDPDTLTERCRSAATSLARFGEVRLANGLAYLPAEELLAFDPTSGALRWRQPLAVSGLGIGAVAVADGLVYSPGPRPLAYRASTGVAAWTEPAAPPTALAATPAVAGQYLWTTGDDGSLACFDLTDGRERWRTPTGFALKAAPLVVGGAVFVVDAAGGVQAWVAG